MTLRFLADENVPKQLVDSLRDGGADVLCISTHSPGIPDREVLAITIAERRVLITFDKDFGELARSADLELGCGVILIRVPMPPAADDGPQLSDILLSRRDWIDCFSVIEPGRIRKRPLVKRSQKI